MFDVLDNFAADAMSAALWAERRIVPCGGIQTNPDENPSAKRSLQEVESQNSQSPSIEFSVVGNSRISEDSSETLSSGAAKDGVDLFRAIRALVYWSEISSHLLEAYKKNTELHPAVNRASVFRNYADKVSACYKTK